MGIFVNRGNASFAKARKSQIYVDKSGMLEYTNSVIDTEQCCLCVSRPRRFGKILVGINYDKQKKEYACVIEGFDHAL